MSKPTLVRITTVPLSLEKLLEGQLSYMSTQYRVIAVSSEEHRLEAFGKAEGVETFAVDMTRKITPLKDLQAVWKLYRFLKRTKPLIVHTHTPKAGIVGMLAARWARVPIRLHTVAGLPLMESRGIKRFILKRVERITYRKANRVYPNSKGLKDFIISEKLAKPLKLKVLGNGSSNGIDTAYFNPSIASETMRLDVRKRLGIPETDFVYVFVGRLVGDKGINELVRAFQKLHSTNNSISLLLVGPTEATLDPLNPDVTHLIETHPKIFSIGYQDDVRPFFRASDALVFPSYREGFPNVVMQAGAMGLPSIVSNINGCNEIIEEGVNGCIVPAKDTASLEDAMRAMSNDKDVYNTMKTQSRPMIKDRYERSVFWKILSEEYNKLNAEL